MHFSGSMLKKDLTTLFGLYKKMLHSQWTYQLGLTYDEIGGKRAKKDSFKEFSELLFTSESFTPKSLLDIFGMLLLLIFNVVIIFLFGIKLMVKSLLWLAILGPGIIYCLLKAVRFDSHIEHETQ